MCYMKKNVKNISALTFQEFTDDEPTALLIACYLEDIPMMKTLLTVRPAGADINLQSISGRLPIWYNLVNTVNTTQTIILSFSRDNSPSKS